MPQEWAKTRDAAALSRSITAQKRIVELLPRSAEARVSLGNELYLSTDDAGAQQQARVAIELDENNPRALKLLGRVLDRPIPAHFQLRVPLCLFPLNFNRLLLNTPRIAPPRAGRCSSSSRAQRKASRSSSAPSRLHLQTASAGTSSGPFISRSVIYQVLHQPAKPDARIDALAR